MVNFLNPFLLSLVPLVSVPILIHLAQRRRFQIVRWAAMEFLLNAETRSTKKRKIQHLILLILRTLIIFFIVMAAARPLIKKSSFAAIVGKQNTHAIIILDDSFSMGHTKEGISLFDRAKESAAQIISLLRPGDAVSLILASYPSRAVGNPSFQPQGMVRDIMNLKVSQKATDYIGAVALAREALEKTTLPRKEIYIIGDCQNEGWKHGEASEGRDPLTLIAGKAQVYIVKTSPPDVKNAAVTNVIFPRTVVDTLGTSRVVASIANFSKYDFRQITVGLVIDDLDIETKSVTVGPEATTFVDFRYQFNKPGIHNGYVEFKSDSLTVDNKYYFTVKVLEKIQVLYIQGEGITNIGRSAPFFEYALNPTDNDLIRLERISPSQFSQYRERLSDYSVIVLSNVSSLTRHNVEALEEFVREGGGLFIALGDAVDSSSYNQEFYRDKGLLPGRLAGMVGDARQLKDFHMVADIIKEHESMRVFGNAEITELKTVKFYQYYKVDVDKNAPGIVTVVASFQDGSPLLIENRFGKGKLMLLTTTTDTRWNDFPRAVMYLPFMQQVIYSLIPFQNRDVKVEESLIRDLTYREFREFGSEKPVVANPNKEVSSPSLNPAENGYRIQYDKTESAGMYILGKGTTNAVTTVDRFAVNIDNIESNLSNLSEEELRSLFPDAKFVFFENESNIRDKLTRERIGMELWKPLMYLILIFGITESILSHKFTGRR